MSIIILHPQITSGTAMNEKYFFFFFPKCIHHSGQEESPRLPLVFNASLHSMGQQYLLCNLLVRASNAVPSTQNTWTYCSCYIGVCWFQMQGVNQRLGYTQNSHSLALALTPKASFTDAVTGHRQKVSFKIQITSRFWLLRHGLFLCVSSHGIEAVVSTRNP